MMINCGFENGAEKGVDETCRTIEGDGIFENPKLLLDLPRLHTFPFIERTKKEIKAEVRSPRREESANE